MVRIEIKKVAEGQIALGIEAKKETPDEVLTCAARGFVGVARNLLGPMATNPQFAEEISRGIKGMLLDTEDLKVTRGVEGKEAKFMAALYGMNAPFAARVKAASSIADMIATAVKQNFLEVVTGKAGKATVFTDKEAAFLSKLMGL